MRWLDKSRATLTVQSPLVARWAGPAAGSGPVFHFKIIGMLGYFLVRMTAFSGGAAVPGRTTLRCRCSRSEPG